jgi:O-antigen ligase
LASGFVVTVAFSHFTAFSFVLIGLLTLVAAANLCFTLRIHRHALLAAAFVTVVYLIGAAIGSIPSSPANWPRWLDRDGSLVVAMLPLILLGTARVRLPDLTMTVRAIEVVVLANLGMFITGLAGVQIINQIAFDQYTFSGLTTSHHAAGMVFGASVMILIAARRSPELGVRPPIALIVGALVLSVGSGSRTAVVGLVAAAFWFALERKRLIEVLRVTTAVVVLGAVALLFSEKLAGTVAGFLSADLWSAAWQQFIIGIGSSESVRYAGGGLDTGEGYIANILARFFYWGIAIGAWLRSPLVGIGSFRFNDENLQYTGIDGFIQLAISGVDRSGGGLAGAHNQYLGTLVENGVLGLVLLLSIWILPYRHIAKQISPPERIRESGRQMVPFALATALTGYSLISPALTFVCLTWLTLVSQCDEDSP